MANQEHLDLLKQGVDVWNQWRKEHLDIRPNLSNADLRNASLVGVDLSRADLRYINLFRANLGKAHLIATSLSGANLSETYLSGADLDTANLNGANLRGAELQWANLSRANLDGANFRHARVLVTIFGDVDLSTMIGLDEIYHEGPSIIGIDTIYNSKGQIPEDFLRGAGVNDTFISYIRSLVGNPIDYYSCFISYSSRDEPFAKRLYADLQSNNVRCWFAPEDLKWGARIRSSIDEAILLHDKLLLVISKHSVASGWVEHEVKNAVAKERKEKRTVLFPVRLDNAAFDSPLSWATEIRHERNIGDFTRWKTHDDYQKAFTRLLRDLKAEPSRRL
jgi:uncharacterized protein YjbI with pentapeptide repeats